MSSLIWERDPETSTPTEMQWRLRCKSCGWTIVKAPAKWAEPKDPRECPECVKNGGGDKAPSPSETG